MDASAARRAWDHDGFVVHRGMWSADEAAALLEVVRTAEPLVPGPNELTLGEMEFRSNLFARSAALRAWLSSPRVVTIVTDLLGPDVWCRWDQAVAKRAGAGWFPWHQDNGYSKVDGIHLQLWVALTTSTEDDGGLQVAPGRHRAPLDHVWVGSHVVADPGGPTQAIDARPGDAIAFSSMLPHATGPNTSGRDRWAYVAEFLPLRVADRSVPTPHLVVARGGRPALEVVDLTPTWPAGGA